MDPTLIDEVWSGDQSLVRRDVAGSTLTPDEVASKKPCIPGWNAGQSAFCLVPCVCPASKLWLNKHQRFITAAEMMQMQGMPLADFPCWRLTSSHALASGAGNAFAMPSACIHLVIALARLAGLGCSPVQDPRSICQPLSWKSAATDDQLPEFTVSGIARFYVNRFLKLHAAHYTSSTSSTRLVAPTPVKVGTLCSGTDCILLFARAAANHLRREGRVGAGSIIHSFACESDPRMSACQVFNDTCWLGDTALSRLRHRGIPPAKPGVPSPPRMCPDARWCSSTSHAWTRRPFRQSTC
jgi:hypothetical protein